MDSCHTFTQTDKGEETQERPSPHTSRIVYSILDTLAAGYGVGPFPASRGRRVLRHQSAGRVLVKPADFFHDITQKTMLSSRAILPGALWVRGIMKVYPGATKQTGARQLCQRQQPDYVCIKGCAAKAYIFTHVMNLTERHRR